MLRPTARAATPGHYAAFGLTILSELDLPELARIDGAGPEADVAVRIGALGGDGWEGVVEIAADAFRLNIEGIGRFEVLGGRTVTVDPDPAATPAELRAYLLGTVFGALFQQRGVLALHASAVATGEGEAVAFLGESGAGKSTLAMAMNARGHALLCDDVCVVLDGEQGGPVTWPGVRRLKLWSQSIALTGATTAGLEPVLQREDKFHVPSNRIAPYQPHRLRAIFLLEATDSGEAAEIARLRGAAAVQALVSHTFRGRLVPFMEAAERHFRACLALVGACPIYRLRRPWELGRIDVACDAIEQHLSQE